jgi:CheY-like chemotaxis protein
MPRSALVIDDEPDLRTYLSAILEDHGWSVRTAATAVEGEELIREQRPDLVLLDLVMPGRNGIQFFARLRGDEATRSIPVIMVTGIREQLNIDWGSIVGRLKARVPDGFIEKPIDRAALTKLIDEVIAGTTHRPEPGT